MKPLPKLWQCKDIITKINNVIEEVEINLSAADINDGMGATIKLITLLMNELTSCRKMTLHIPNLAVGKTLWYSLQAVRQHSGFARSL